MEKILFPQINRFPILIRNRESKTCYFLGKDSCLHQFEAGERGWHPVSLSLGQKPLRGFDAVIDLQGRHLLIAFDDKGALYLIRSEQEKNPPIAFYQEPGRETACLSACLDSQNVLHLLQLSTSKVENDSLLTYHRLGEGRWEEPLTLDPGPGKLRQFATLLDGPEDSLYIFYYVENGALYPTLRRIGGKSILGKTIVFPGSWDNPLLPSICFTEGQTLHYSLINRHLNGTTHLKYASMASGRWINSLTREITPFTLPLAPLYLQENRLLLAWKSHHNTLSCLISSNFGNNWQYAGNCQLGQYTRLFRLRTFPKGKDQNTKWQAAYLFADGIPPQQLIEPDMLANYAKDAGPLEKGFQNLDHLYSSLATHAGQIQSININLQNKLNKKEQEYYQLYTKSINQIKEFQKAETSFKNTIKELQNLLRNEKKLQEEKLEKLSGEISHLKEEMKKLRVEIIDRENTIKELKETNSLLEKRNKEFLDKRPYFWQKLFR